MNALKSIGAVVAGFLAVVVLSMATDVILEKAGIFPPPTGGLFITWMLVLAFAYRSVYTIVGGYITAAFSPEGTGKRNVVILAIIGTIGGIIGVVSGWDLSAHWYPIALAVTAFPLVWLGGKLRLKQ
jgi:hypothetical protein